MADVNASLEEGIQMVNALTKVYAAATASDVQRIRTFCEVRTAIRGLCSDQLQAAESAKQELQQQLEKAQKEATRPEPEEKHRERLYEIEKERISIASRVHESEQRKQFNQSKLREVEEQEESLRRKQVQAKADTEVHIPLQQFRLTLYRNATHLRWDYDSSNIKGIVFLPRRKDTRGFEIAPDANPCQVADHLWGLMEDC